jgi:dTMP kinase
VRAAFLDLAAAEPERFLVLDASRPPADLAAEIRSRIESVLRG